MIFQRFGKWKELITLTFIAAHDLNAKQERVENFYQKIYPYWSYKFLGSENCKETIQIHKSSPFLLKNVQFWISTYVLQTKFQTSFPKCIKRGLETFHLDNTIVSCITLISLKNFFLEGSGREDYNQKVCQELLANSEALYFSIFKYSSSNLKLAFLKRILCFSS